MNRFILSLLTILFPMHLAAQMLTVSHHYKSDALSINPAFAGCYNSLSATLLYRNQWVGFSEAPKSQMLSVHAPLNNDRIGLGLLIEKNSIGIFKETNFIGNYAYRIELGEGKLSFGLGFGVTVHNIAWNELIASDANDIQLINNPSTAVLPAFSLGTYYYTKKYFIGFSIPLFLTRELNQSSGTYKISNDFSKYNYFLSGGYEFNISPLVKLLPSLLIKYQQNTPVQIDYNALVSLKERIWFGIGYRSKNMLAGILQCQLNYQIRLGYSYDIELGSLGKYVNGSHEIGLNYIFRYSRKVMGPRQF
jgi:type IX secretion system PorP/SprF family membrane protein